MAGCCAFQLEPSQVHVPSDVTATISCWAGSPANPEEITCGPALNVLGFDHELPFQVVTLPLQHVTRPGAGKFVGIGTGRALGSGEGTTGTGTGDAVAAFAVAFGTGNTGGGVMSGSGGVGFTALPEELPAPDDPSTTGHGIAVAADTGAPQA